MNRYGNVVARSAELFAFPHALRQQRTLVYTCLSARLALLWVLSCWLCSCVLAQTSFINLGFETPNLGGNYQYSPSAAAWSFSGGGITGNGNGFTSGNAAAPQGLQVAFVQGPGSSVVQTANLAAGQYTISFSAAQRGNYQLGTQVVHLQVDGVLVGQYQPPGIGYTTYQTSTFTVASTGNHTIAFVGAGSGSDFTAFVDDVRINAVSGASEVLWFDDALPAGALTGGDGEAWTWVSSAPAAYSGVVAHQSGNLAGEHQHYFWNASATLNVAAGDSLFAYVYLDPSNPPSEVMLQWNDGSWEHRAYWGANQIGWGSDGTSSRQYMGPLPTSGQWVQLVVPASAVALEGHVLNGMAFTLYGGRATFDYAGKTAAGALQAQTIAFGALSSKTLGASPFGITALASSGLPVSFSSLTTTVCTVSGGTVTIIAVGMCTIRAAQPGNASFAAAANVNQSFSVTGFQPTVVWFDDALPAGALTGGDGEAWTWVSSAPAAYSGVVAHQSGNLAGEHQHYFWNASATLNVATGDSLFAYVYLDPSNPPSEIMLQWNDGSWEHRAYWGANQIGWGIDGTSSRQYMGPLPTGAQWVQLVVPASVVALEGHVLNGMAFTLYGGRATFDYAGKTVVAAAQQAQTITFGALSSKTFGAAPFGISATASSGLAVSFSSLTTTVCTVSSGAVTIVAVGTCTIRALQPGNASYLAAPNIDQSFSITQSAQTISFGALANRTLGSGSFAVSATASSGLVVTFTSPTTTVCTISGTTITLLTGGTCTIRAAQLGNALFLAASNVDQSFSITVAQLAQTIAFSPLADQFVGALPSTLWASASSGLPVSFASMTPTTCSIVADQATALSAGACTVRASHAGNGSYTAAANIDRTMKVVAGAATGPLFNRPVDYAAGLYPDAIVSRDFNGDGKLDLAVANWSDGTVSVLLGQGDGTFAPAATYPVGVGPMAIVAADFNGDGKLDLATANLLSKDVSVLLGRGDGTFARADTVNIGVALFGLAAGDLNGDGKLDLAVTNGTSNGVTGQSVYILSGNGAGAFSIAGSLPTGLNPMAIAVADVNGDGKQDLIVTNADSNTMSVLLGAGNGSFFGQVTYATSYSPQDVAVGDVNGDGKLDVIVTNSWTNNVSVLVNRGDGTFLPAVNYEVGSAPGAVVIGDFNGDGKPDLAVVDELQDDIAVLAGNGNGIFQAAAFYGVLGHPLGIAVGDFNGDNKLDLAVATTASNAVSVLLRPGSAGVPATLAVSSGSPQSAAVSTQYATPLAVMVRDRVGQPLAGTLVTFTAPSTGPSGSFTAGATAQAISGATGIATAPTFTANATTGTFSVTATGGSLSALFALTNTGGANAAPAFTSAPPPNGTFNVAYNYLIKATGVPAPSLSVLANALPPGLALSGTTGSISGTPSATGTFSGMLTATNAIPPDANQSFAITIAAATQSITFAALSDKPLGAATFAVSAAASSGLMVVFSSLTSSVCTVSGATVTLVSTGTCTVRASQGGNANYAAALDVDTTFTVISTPLLLQPSASTFNVNADELTITGAVQAPLNSSLVVGGVEAMIDATGRFFVDHVPVAPATSSVSLTLKSSDGRTTTQNVQVIATGAPAPVVLTAHPSRGIPPLDATFRLQNNTGAVITKIEMDGFGTGTYSDTTGAFAQQGYVMIDYPLPGTYHPTVRLTDTSGKTYVQSTTVVVDRPSDWDQVFRDIWQTMNGALTAGSSPTALAYLTTAANARYTRVFTDLAGQFPGIVASYGPLLLIEITGSYATYAVTRTSGGVQKVYFIEFVKDEDGIWRIDSM